MSSFFRNIDARDASDIPLGDAKGKIKALKARVSSVLGIIFFMSFV